MSKDIFQAAKADDIPALTRLLDAQPDLVHSRDQNQYTALHGAAGHGCLAAAGLLLRRGADPNAQGPVGEAPLHLTSDPEMAKVLVACGGNPRLSDRGGITPMDWALRENNSGLFLILAQGAPALGSPHYQLLKVSRDRKLHVIATYEGTPRLFRVIQLGWTERAERCFAYQVTGRHEHPKPGPRCYVVDKMSQVYLEDPYEHEPEGDQEHPPCVAVVDDTPYKEESATKGVSPQPPYERM